MVKVHVARQKGKSTFNVVDTKFIRDNRQYLDLLVSAWAYLTLSSKFCILDKHGSANKG